MNGMYHTARCNKCQKEVSREVGKESLDVEFDKFLNKLITEDWLVETISGQTLVLCPEHRNEFLKFIGREDINEGG